MITVGTTRRLPMLALLLAALALMVQTEAARAAQYTVQACELTSGEPGHVYGDWEMTPGFWEWRTVNACPDQLRFERDKSIAHNKYAQFSVRTRGAVSALTLTVEGGDWSDGAVYTVESANPIGTAVELPRLAPGDPPARVTVALPNAGTVILRAKCVAPGSTCGPGGSMILRDFVFTMHDDVAPRLLGPWSAWFGAGTLRVGAWNNEDNLRINFWATDGGTGVRNASVQVVGALGWSHLSTCPSGTAWTVALPCPESTTKYEGKLVTDASRDGRYELRASATDALGNRADLDPPATFGIDRVAPKRPSHAIVEGVNNRGWTSEPIGDLSWRTNSEPVESNTESGVDHAVYDVDPVDSPGSDDPSSMRTSPGSIDDLELPGDGIWDVFVKQVDRAGNMSDDLDIRIRRDTTAPEPPLLHRLDWIGPLQLIEGVSQTWSRPTNVAELESGICGYAATFGNDSPGPVANIAGDVTSVAVPSSLGDGSSAVRVRTISCAGLASGIAESTVRVDGAPPAVSLVGVDAQNWSSSPVTAGIKAVDDESGIAGITHELDDNGAINTVGGTVDVDLPDGSHTLRFEAFDRVGNTSLAETATVRVDTKSPQAWIEPSDYADPTSVTAFAGDSASGIAGAQIEWARIDEGATNDEQAWRRIGQPLDHMAPGLHRLTATLPDVNASDGVYALRVVARDRAGNVEVGNTVRGGIAQITLPVRSRSALSARLAPMIRKCPRASTRGARSCRQVADLRNARGRLTIDHGQRARLLGEFRGDDGRPLSGVALEVIENPTHGERVVVGSISTGADGSYAFAIPAGASRTFTVRYAGDRTRLPASASAELGVRAGMRLSASSRTLRVGRTLFFKGRLLSGSAGIPAAGKIYWIEYLSGGRWTTAIRAARTDLKGRLKVAWTPVQPVRRAKRLKFRVYLPGEGSWPYADGVSNVVTVKLRP